MSKTAPRGQGRREDFLAAVPLPPRGLRRHRQRRDPSRGGVSPGHLHHYVPRKEVIVERDRGRAEIVGGLAAEPAPLDAEGEGLGPATDAGLSGAILAEAPRNPAVAE